MTDSLQIRIYLEATSGGLPLYYKYGWNQVGELVLDLELYGDVGKETFTLMVRDPVSLSDSRG
jgi:hypothetical protein